MKSTEFSVKTIIKKLVNHYGLPAFLFTEIDPLNFNITSDAKFIHVQLIPYDHYTKLSNYIELGKKVYVFEDLWRSHEEIVASKFSWFAKMHDKIDARNCTAIKVSETDATVFLNRFHLMNYAKSTYHYALIFEKQICAIASFSHGRKMNRLPEGKLGYELVRFATLPNLSITGGMSKLISKFAEEVKPGDIMTYIDPLTGETKGLKKIGFKEIETTKPVQLYVDILTHQRLHKINKETKNAIEFLTLGNSKLVKTFV